MTTQYGAPLTGAQMKLLRAAGLPDGAEYEYYIDSNGLWVRDSVDYHLGFVTGHRIYHLPADHIAYTLLEAGWLDGRNVALWFGGDKAPDDWDGGVILTRGGYEDTEKINSPWWCYPDDKEYSDIIAYTRKAEGLTTHADRVLADAERMAKRMGGKFVKNEYWGDVVAASGEAAKADACAGCHGLNTSCPDGCFDGQHETVTLAKMTEAEVSEVALSHRMTTEEAWGAIKFCRSMGLIREPTRLERFWATRNTKDVYGPPCKAFQLIEEALNFEK